MLNNIAALLDAGVAASTTSYESIQTVTVGAGGLSTASFTAIPSTFKHLQLRMIIRGSANNSLAIKINSDTGSNYARHRLYGSGSAASAASNTSATSGFIFSGNGVPTGSSIFGAAIVDILDYTDTNKYKTIRTLDGVDTNGGGGIEFISNLWQSTSAITQLDLFLDAAATIQEYSSFALYGIKG